MKTLPLFLLLLVGLTNSLFAGGDDRDMEVIDSVDNKTQELLVDEALLTSVEVEQVEEKQTTELISLKTQSDQVNKEIAPISEPSDEKPYPSEPVEEEFKEAFNDESELASKENEEQATIKISKDEVIDTKASQYELIALLAFLLLVIATIYVARRNSTLRKRSRLQIK